ncbi:isoprenylcysteine carboxylmethyltransferase family protein [Mumia zhuanghuii]|uniref:Methyltransferase family protein n=2 Tax=Mumia TaxID=1546255 RepID=A0ABW1QI22_9ACTN|nr:MULTISPECIES: methyltransferase [Mumia]KAA1422633.1 isoprenylcysteine carboxylmethyltransferase family protein [Mumia zhuanghuii]
MNDPGTVRALGLAVPVLAVVVLAAWRRPDDRRLAAVLVATAWTAVALMPVNLLAVALGWWSFAADGAVWRGVPIDLWLAWALLWGAVPALITPALSPLLVGAVLVWVDLAFMPWGEPVVRLGPSWLVGEVVAVAVALVPAYALARWTLAQRHVSLRGWAQAWCAGALLVGAPLVVLGVAPRWSHEVTAAGIQVAVVVSVPAVAAMRDLARVGGGTPLPYDPPSRLVTVGPYAYVRNPMQVSMAVLFLVLAVTVGDPRLAFGAVVTVVYSAGLAAWHEGERMAEVFGPSWTSYAAVVPAWVPRWRPYEGRTARLYVAADCSMCTGLGQWLLERRPVALDVLPAAEHPDMLWRLTYEAEGVRDQGVAAFARALGHVNLAWALAGWTLALPGICHFAQLGADAFGAGPRPARADVHRAAGR